MDGIVGRGEAEAIALTIIKSLPLVTDDDHARRIANYHNVETYTTLGVILSLLLARKINKEDYIFNLRRHLTKGWVTADVVERFLREVEGLW